MRLSQSAALTMRGELVSGLSGSSGCPFLLLARYDEGTPYILSVPENFGDLYYLPREVLRVMREVFIMKEDAPSKVCLFLYDDRAFIVESSLPHVARLEIVVRKGGAELSNVLPRAERYFRESVHTVKAEDRTIFQTVLMPYSHSVYRVG